MTMQGLSALTIFLVLVSVFSGFAASKPDIDRLTTYATVLGRAVGCGLDTDDASRRIGAWMDRTFPPRSQDQKTYLPIFMAGVQHHAQQQRSGQSPDGCTQVARTFKSMAW